VSGQLRVWCLEYWVEHLSGVDRVCRMFPPISCFSGPQSTMSGHVLTMLVSGSENLAIPIRAPWFERSLTVFSIREPFWKARDLYSRASFCVQPFVFARYSEKLAMSIRVRFFERSVFYSRENLNTRDLYSCAGVCICKFNNDFFDILIIPRSWVVVFSTFVYFESSRT